jgi:hypothetical protein
MKIRVVLYYTNDTSYTLRNVVGLNDFAGQIQVASQDSRRISNVVSENTGTITTIGKSDLLGYSIVEKGKITYIKLSDRFSTLVVTR